MLLLIYCSLDKFYYLSLDPFSTILKIIFWWAIVQPLQSWRFCHLQWVVGPTAFGAIISCISFKVKITFFKLPPLSMFYLMIMQMMSIMILNAKVMAPCMSNVQSRKILKEDHSLLIAVNIKPPLLHTSIHQIKFTTLPLTRSKHRSHHQHRVLLHLDHLHIVVGQLLHQGYLISN